jgi:hypothetical protein
MHVSQIWRPQKPQVRAARRFAASKSSRQTMQVGATAPDEAMHAPRQGSAKIADRGAPEIVSNTFGKKTPGYICSQNGWRKLFREVLRMNVVE